MWIPESTSEIVSRAESGDLEETASFDAKREVYRSSKKLAKHIAAMSTDGGTLLFGVDEDENGQPTCLSPVDLDGTPERISNIVETCIAEPPEVNIRAYESEDDPSKGYIAVAVPASERAPHMLIKNNDNRFYGRNAKGTRRLSEGDVARLYARRERWERDRDAWLDEIVADAPFEPTEDQGYLHVGVRPLLTKRGLLERAAGGGGKEKMTRVVHQLISNTDQVSVGGMGAHPPFRAAPGRWQPDGWSVSMGADPSRERYEPRNTLDLHLREDGEVRLFCGRAADTRGDDLMLMDLLIAEHCVRCLFLSGNLYHSAGHYGTVDVGVAVTGIEGAKPLSNDSSNRFFTADHSLEQDQYHRTMRCHAPTLFKNAKGVAADLVGPLLRAALQRENLDFFED